MSRRGRITAAFLLGLPVALLLAAVVALPRVDLAPFAAARATAALGREVTIGSLRVVPGRVATVALREARVANIEGGSRPVMAELARLDATVELLPLLAGRLVLHGAEAEGLRLYLERAPDRRANWRAGDGTRGDAPPQRGGPLLPQDLRLARSEVVFRTTGGAELRTVIEDGRLTAEAPDRPARLQVRGSYNGVALRVEGVLGTLRQMSEAAAPMPVALRATAADTAMLLEGTATDPLNFDGIAGTLTFAASGLRDVFALAGEAGGPDLPVEFAAQARREGNLWRLTDLAGTIDGDPVTAALFELREGSAGTPDAVAARLAFERLDLARLLDAMGSGGDAADPRLQVPARPDPLIRAEIAADSFSHPEVSGTDAAVTLEVAPARLALEARLVTAFGVRVEGRGQMVPAGEGARLDATLRLPEAELDALRRHLGFGELPVAGRATVDAVVAASGATFGAARQGARVSAVLTMAGGSIAREVIEMASTDIRSLFRTPRGRTGLGCVLAAVDLRGTRGEVAPLRLRAGTGTVAGLMSFDLGRRQLDLVIGSERATTHDLALDIPVRVSGTFGDLDIAPAEWSRAGRERLSRGEMAPLPRALSEIARASPCYRRGGVAR